MSTEDNIIQSDRRLQADRVASCVLSANKWGGVEWDSGEDVGKEAKNIEWEVREAGARCGSAAVVQVRLGVKGYRPWERINPPQDTIATKTKMKKSGR